MQPRRDDADRRSLPPPAPGPLQRHAFNYLQDPGCDPRHSHVAPPSSAADDLSLSLARTHLGQIEAQHNKPLPPLPGSISGARPGVDQGRPFPSPTRPLGFPVPAPYCPGALPRPPSVFHQEGASGHRPPSLPARPAPQTRPIASQTATATPHPASMRPGEIAFFGTARPPTYPWELVPARRQDAHDPVPRPASIASSSRPSSEAVPPKTSAGTAAPSAARLTLGDGIPSSAAPKRGARVQSAPPATTSPGGPVRGSPLTKTGMVTAAAERPAKGQCWGIKQNGTRCTRRVKKANGHGANPARPAASRGRGATRSPAAAKRATVIVISDNSDDDESSPATSRLSPAADDDEAYCFQHVAEINKSTGFYATAQGRSDDDVQVFVDYSDYLDTDVLTDHAQALLRKCMAAPPSPSDEDERGYIYIYELRDRSDTDRVCLKVGRAVNVFRRINQWRSQCQSKDPVLRAFFPSSQSQGLLLGADAPDRPGALLSHKWERLVHLELRAVGERVDESCADCGSRHREIFMIPRRGGQAVGGFELARAVVERWMRFVALAAGDLEAS